MKFSIFVFLLLTFLSFSSVAQFIDTTNSYKAIFLEKETRVSDQFNFKRWNQKILYHGTILAGKTQLKLIFTVNIDSLGNQSYWLLRLKKDGSLTQLGLDFKTLSSNLFSSERVFQLFDNSYNEFKLELILNKSENILLYKWLVSETGSKNEEEIPIWKLSSISLNKPMPSLQAKTISENEISFDFKGDSITVINSWATFCHPCIEEIPELNNLVKNYTRSKIRFIAIAFNDKSETQLFLKNHIFLYNHFLFGEKTMEVLGNVFPRHVIIDQNGIVIYDKQGFESSMISEIENAVQRLNK